MKAMFQNIFTTNRIRLTEVECFCLEIIYLKKKHLCVTQKYTRNKCRCTRMEDQFNMLIKYTPHLLICK